MALSQVKVCWLSGNYHDRQGMMKKIKERLSTHEMLILDGEYTFPYFEHQVYNGGCFVDKRLLIVKTMPLPVTKTRAPMISHLKKILEDIPDDLIIIFDGIDGEEAIVNCIKQIGRAYEFDSIISKEGAPEWVVSRFDEAGKKISIEDAQLFVNLNGYDPTEQGIGVDVMYLAVKKLCLYVGKRKTITQDDINITAFPSSEFIIWSIANAMDSKNIEQCYKAWEKLLAKTSSGKIRDAVETLFAIIQSRYRLLIYLKEGITRNVPKSQLAKDAAEFTKLKLKEKTKDFLMILLPEVAESTGNNLPLWSNYAIQEALNGNSGRTPGVDIYGRKELFNILRVIQDAQVEMRYRKTDAGLMLLVDALFFAVCSKMDDIQLALLRRST